MSGRRFLRKIGLVVVILIGVVPTGLAAVFIGGGLFADHVCDQHTRQIMAAEHSEAAALDSVTVFAGQPTRASGQGNTDCVDGGVDDVTAVANFSPRTSFSAAQSAVAVNLKQQAYQAVQQTTGGTDDNATFNDVTTTYKNSKQHRYLQVAYNFPTTYQLQCADGTQVCASPDLTELTAVQVSSVTVTYSTVSPF
jgi:hypothetical protein